MPRDTRAYPFPSIPLVVRYFVALVAVIIVFLAYRMSGTVIDDGGLFLLLSIAVLGSAWFAGSGAALAVTVLGGVLGSIVAGHVMSPAVQTHLAMFVGQGVLLTALVAELRRARQSAETQAGVAELARVEIEAASRMKDEFLGTISHELRTPLNAVLGWLHLIRTGKLDQTAQSRGFESIERNVRLQAQLTADLLDVSKALTGRLKMDMRPVALPAVVAEAVAQVSTAAEAKDIKLHVSTPDQPVIVRGDPNRLRQVIWHLLANAITRDRALRTIFCRAFSIASRRPIRRRRDWPAVWVWVSPSCASWSSATAERSWLEIARTEARNSHCSCRSIGPISLCARPSRPLRHLTSALRRSMGSASSSSIAIKTSASFCAWRSSSVVRRSALSVRWIRRWRCSSPGGPTFS